MVFVGFGDDTGVVPLGNFSLGVVELCRQGFKGVDQRGFDPGHFHGGIPSIAFHDLTGGIVYVIPQSPLASYFTDPTHRALQAHLLNIQRMQQFPFF